MSSVSVSFNRKRVHSPVYRDSSSNSDSEDGSPPVKIKRKNAGASFSFSSVLEIPVAITARLKNLVVWMSALPVKEYFQMAIKAGATLPTETIVIDDDEDEVCIEEDDVIPETENPFIQRLQQSRKLMVSDKRFNRQIETNGSCSTRNKTRNALSYTSNPRCDTYASVNGMNSKNWDPRRNGNGSYNFRQQRTDALKRPAVVSNPETDIEILLETKPEVSTLDGDEIEILSESPNIKQKPRSFQRVNRQCTRAVKSSASHQSPSQSEQSAVTRSQSAKSKQYTAHEVVRLQEKAQYQLLLDKYISGNHYTPLVKKSASNPDPGNDTSIELSGRHFKREVLQQPVADFIEKYYRPCRLMPSDKTSQSSEKKKESDEVTVKEEKDDNSGDDDDDDDDDIQIIDVKLPKYKPKYRQKLDFFSSDWIAELRNTVNAQTEERLKIVQEQEEVIEHYKKERLLQRLNLDSQGSEPSEPEFPELTPEMEEEIEKAMHSGKPDERLCKITSDYLLRKDIETLEGLSWLNDLVINSYFDLIVERSKQEGYPSVYAYNTFFYSTYKAKGYQGVRRWTRKIDIFSYDLNFVPLHLGVHWCLAIIDHRAKKIGYYDSMGNEEEICLDLLHEYLSLEFRDKKGQVLDPSLYITEVMKDIPLQMNGSDCGMFTLKYAEYISRDAQITFAQSHMGYFRRRMVYELLHNQLL